MPKDKLTRASIPKSLLNAKNFAVVEFLLPDTDEPAMAFAARTNPKHNVVGVGLGRKIVKGKLTAQPCVLAFIP